MPPFLSRRHMLAIAGKAALSFSVLLMAGCAGLAPPPNEAALSPAIQRSYSPAIDLDGRLSVQYQKNGQDEALHGSFTWHQTAQDSTVTLRSPLGQTLAIIHVAPGSATLTEAGKPPRTAHDVDALATRSLGWPLPVSGLRHWLQGFATDAAGQPFVASPSADTVTTGDGWRIRYVNWEESDPAHLRPKRIDLARQTLQAGDVALRIVIDDWQTH